jgi:predicted GIY-YIG superfamily endonuclease
VTRPTTLYRLFNAENELLYVGISASAISRFQQHQVEKDWWTSITATVLEHFDTRTQALAAEQMAIQTEGPKFNVHHNRNRSGGSCSARGRSITVPVDDDIHAAFVAEAARRSQLLRRHVSLAELVRNELAKSAERFRRKGNR